MLACHISPLKSVRRIDSSATSRSSHYSTWSFSFNCWLLIYLRSFRVSWVLSRYDSQLAAIAFNTSTLCLYYIRLWSTCGWNHSSRNWLTVGCDPYFSIVRYRLKIFHTVSQIKVLFLLLFLLLIRFSEAFQIIPLWNEHLISLRDWRSKSSPHAQFCWTQLTPGQWGSSVTQ